MRAGAPRLSDGTYDLLLIKKWLRRKRKGEAYSNRDPVYIYCRGRLGELVRNREVEGLLLAGLSDVEVGLITIARGLAVHGELSPDMRRLVMFFLQFLAKPLLKQIGGDSPSGASSSSFGPELQLRIIE